MAGVRVITDSASDLPHALVDELGIAVVPLSIRFGDVELIDDRDLTPQEFWARCATSPSLPETAAPAPGAFEKAYRAAAADGADAVVCITLSANLSATHQSATLGAQAVDDIDVRVVDSRSVSMGQGLGVLAAARGAAAGKSADDVVAIAEEAAQKTLVFAALDTLDNLKRGGRIGGAQAFLGTLLSIKPIIEVVDGVVEAESKQRTRSKSLRYLVDKVREHPDHGDLAVVHAEAPDLDELLDLLGEVHPRDEIVVADVGAVIGTHAGPRVVGVALLSA